jgi:flagellar hook protein FlgE
VQGWASVNGALNTNGPVGDILLPGSALQQPFATTKYKLEMNLDASASTGAIFSTPMEAYDSLGNQHVLTATFTKTGANAWSYDISIPGADLTSGTAGTPSSVASGNFAFDSNGQLTTPPPPPPAANADLPIPVTGLADGAADINISWNIFDPETSQGFITQFSQTSAVSGNNQDGTPAAQLSKFVMSDDGKITAQYSNSQQKVVAQLALAGIRNPDTLVSMGNGELEASALTSLASIGIAGTGGRGGIVGGALEASTVDIAREFTNLIVLQRSYEANSKVVTAADQVTQATIQLKQ